MSVSLTIIAILVIAAIAFVACRRKALVSGKAAARQLHSLPGYYGWNGFVMAFLPALALLVAWSIIQPVIIESSIRSMLPADRVVDETSVKLAMADVRRVAAGLDVAVAFGTMSEQEAGMIRTEFHQCARQAGECGRRAWIRCYA